MAARGLPRLRLATMALLATFGAAVSGRDAAVAPQPAPRLTLAVLPCTNIETTFRKFQPLLAYVKSETGLSLRLLVPADVTELEVATTNARVDLALQDPHTFDQVWRLFDETSLLQTVGLDGTTNQSGVVIVRRDSGLKELSQLRGRAVMFGPRISSPKWVAATLLFEAHGIAVDRELKALSGGCCEDIAFAVTVKTVDAGVICDHFLGLHEGRQKQLGVEPGSLEVIGRTPPVPTRIFAARKGLPAPALAGLVGALLRLDPANSRHREILESAEIGGFVRTTRAAYLEKVVRSPSRERR